MFYIRGRRSYLVRSIFALALFLHGQFNSMVFLSLLLEKKRQLFTTQWRLLYRV